MKAITKMLKAFVLLSFLLLITNCVTDEADQQLINQSTNDVKVWYDAHQAEYTSTILKFASVLKWDDAIITEGTEGQVVEIPFELEKNLSSTNEKGNLYNDHHRLMFIKDGQNKFKVYYVQIFTNDENSKVLDKNYNYYNINDNFDGKVFVQDLATKKTVKLIFKNGKEVKLSLTSKMREEQVDCVWYGYWYGDGHFEPIGLVYCEGAGPVDDEPNPGYGGRGTSPSTPSPPSIEDDAPPSCASFNFVNTTSLWQTALVKNITFRIVLLDETGAHIIHSISYPQPISFGMPTNHSVGGTNITAGIAATLSAQALKISMQEVVNMYGSKYVSEMVVDQYFRERLANNYPLVTSGGRVNFNSTENLPATNYQTTLLFSDDCE
ncbi:hypothetical protein [Flavobacterium sp. GSB-24]|uniref:hypothetical protein n=1 Tax=Flavobacterium sp. GSB-24 TaxID=2994319 RepID=UPI00249253EA|nr:hypothetical protein [Flavobacterium sp. GSB-24]BDU24961.1 hypothetical protein FLGSB24_17050 [Flavobacterium sp. GSB-24]